MANGWGDSQRSGRLAGLLGLAGTLVAVVSLALAGATGAPYLESDGVNGWLVVFAAGLLAGLISLPFGLELRMRERHPDRDRRWEVAVLVWGAVAVILLALAFAAGFDTGTLVGAASLIAAIEAGLLVATIAVWLVSGG